MTARSEGALPSFGAGSVMWIAESVRVPLRSSGGEHRVALRPSSDYPMEGASLQPEEQEAYARAESLMGRGQAPARDSWPRGQVPRGQVPRGLTLPNACLKAAEGVAPT